MDSPGRLARRRLWLLEQNAVLVHHAAAKSPVTDALSCLPATGEDHTPLENDRHIFAIKAMGDNDHYICSANIPRGDTILRVETLETLVESLPNKSKIVVEQTGKCHLLAAKIDVGHPRSKFHTNNRDTIVQKSPVH